MARTKRILPQTSWDLSRALKLRIEGGLSLEEIAKSLGISKSTLHQGLTPYLKLINGDISDITAYRDNRLGLYDHTERMLLNDLADDDRRQKASLNNTAYALKQVHDMRRLEAGQSTQNISYLDLTKSLSEAREMRKKLEQEASARGWDIEEMSEADNQDNNDTD